MSEVYAIRLLGALDEAGPHVRSEEHERFSDEELADARSKIFGAAGSSKGADVA